MGAAHRALAWNAAGLALACAGFADAQATFKCVDKTGRVTYTNARCEEQGLKDAGAVRDRMMVVPAQSAGQAAQAAAKGREVKGDGKGDRKGAEISDTRESPQGKAGGAPVDRSAR